MWCIARVDCTIGKTESPFLNSLGLFGLVWAYRMKDLPSFEELRAEWGFCIPTDDLVMMRPDGTVKVVDEGRTDNVKR